LQPIAHRDAGAKRFCRALLYKTITVGSVSGLSSKLTRINMMGINRFVSPSHTLNVQWLKIRIVSTTVAGAAPELPWSWTTAHRLPMIVAVDYSHYHLTERAR
jgi:hypothetical protein